MAETLIQIILEKFKSPEKRTFDFFLLDTTYILLIKYQSTLSSKLSLLAINYNYDIAISIWIKTTRIRMFIALPFVAAVGTFEKSIANA